MTVGLCGFSMAMPAYPRHFPIVEVQQTFYQPPAPATLRRWRELMPPGFEFTVKAWQLVTHAATSSTYRRLRRPLTDEERAGLGGFRQSAIVDEGWATTVACARALGATAILFQCPASFRPERANLARMRAFFERIERPAGVRLLWEPRGPWPDDEVAELCAGLDLAHVVDPFVARTLTPDRTYYRLHGLGSARHSYSDGELRELRDMLPDEGEAYVLFNNLPRVGDARRFQALLGDEATEPAHPA